MGNNLNSISLPEEIIDILHNDNTKEPIDSAEQALRLSFLSNRPKAFWQSKSGFCV